MLIFLTFLFLFLMALKLSYTYIFPVPEDIKGKKTKVKVWENKESAPYYGMLCNLKTTINAVNDSCMHHTHRKVITEHFPHLVE